MIVVRLRGGLGNQLFQYAMAKRVAIYHQTTLKIDLTSLLKKSNRKEVTNRSYQLHIFNIEDSFLINPKTIKNLYALNLGVVVQVVKFFKYLGLKKIKEKEFTVNQNIIKNPPDHVVFSGYWQSFDYFKSANENLKQILSFKEYLSAEALNIEQNIKSQTHPVCVHVRRGDYVNNTVFNLSSLDYFYNAAEKIYQTHSDAHFFVFSDDPQWCQQNIKFNYPFTVVDYKTEKLKYKEDLQLMSTCKHFIMSASSFSWWAVWLSHQKSNMVICPDPWFNDNFKDTCDLLINDWLPLSVK